LLKLQHGRQLQTYADIMFPRLAETFIVKPFGQKAFFLAKRWNFLAGQVDGAKICAFLRGFVVKYE
jgi:hypothetical protein